MNGDQLTDLVLVDNKKAKIEFLIQTREKLPPKNETSKPLNERDLEDNSFQRSSFYTEKWIQSMEIGDLNGDQKKDLLVTDDKKNVWLYFQKNNLDFTAPTKLGTKGKDVLLYDFSNDGLLDILIANETEFSILNQQKEGLFTDPTTYLNLKFSQCVLADMNGDQQMDLVFLRDHPDQPISIRFMNNAHQFGPECAFEAESIRDLLPIKTPFSSNTTLLTLNDKTASVKLYQYQRTDPSPQKRFHFSALRLYPVSGSANREVSLVSINNDPTVEILLSDPETSQINVFFQTQGELEPSKNYPSLLALNSLAPGYYRDLKKCELLITSQKEQSLGLSSWEASGRLSFPELLPTQGKVVIATSASLLGDERHEIVYITEENARQYTVKIISFEENNWIEKRSLSLPSNESSARPREIFVEDVNRDGKPDLLVIWPSKPLMIFLNQGDLNFKNMSEFPEYREGLISDVGVGALSLEDLDQDGFKEILFCQQNFVRVITIDSHQKFQILDQLNGSQSTSELLSACLGDFNGDQKRELAVFNKSTKSIDILEKQDNGSFRCVNEIPVGAFQFRKMMAVDLSGDGKTDLFLMGKDQFGIILGESSEEKLILTDSHISELNNGNARFSTVTSGDFNHDQQLDLALVEISENYIVFLNWSFEQKLQHIRKFRVFQIDGLHGQSEKKLNEPRELATGDFNHDGKTDLVALIHDRVIFYFQD